MEELRQTNLRMSDAQKARLDRARGNVPRNAYLRAIVESFLRWVDGDAQHDPQGFVASTLLPWTRGPTLDARRGELSRLDYLGQLLDELEDGNASGNTVTFVASTDGGVDRQEGPSDLRRRLIQVWQAWERAYREPVGGWDGVEEFQDFFVKERDRIKRRVLYNGDAALVEDVNQMRRFVAAGGDLRISIRGEDNMAPARAVLLGQLDDLMDDILHQQRSRGNDEGVTSGNKGNSYT